MVHAHTLLIVSSAGEVDLSLRRVLNEAGMRVRVAKSCAEALQALNGPSPPPLVFCDASLPDGTWVDILTSGQAAQVPVIVVPRLVDINLYIDALEKGAADFIVPPFYGQVISHVLSCALHGTVAVQTVAAA
jgi:DNA-binding NtrC family response regulator